MKKQPFQFEPDPALESLLDEVLGHEAAPAGLVQRTLAVTQPMLARRRSVLAWLGPVRAVAAAVLLAAGVSVLVISNGIVGDARDRVATMDELAQVAAVANAYQTPSARIDDEISLLALHMKLLSDSGLLYDPHWHAVRPMIDERDLLDHVEMFF